jgi:phosphatidate phosphatase APP1
VTERDETTSTGKVLVPPDGAQFGVISDIDDTILQSSATDLFRMARLTFFNNAYTRTPFPKVSAFYRALERGAGGAGPNPIFYVSSSAWNLYDLLDDFLRVHDIPEGPILLRDLGLDSEKLIASGHDHKLEKIDEILSFYPRLAFLLIGDSGQRDPWIYREAVRRHPGRILAVYIRDVSSRRRDEIAAIANELAEEKVDMLLVQDAEAAARHAAANGLISDEALAEIARSPE